MRLTLQSAPDQPCWPLHHSWIQCLVSLDHSQVHSRNLCFGMALIGWLIPAGQPGAAGNIYRSSLGVTDSTYFNLVSCSQEVIQDTLLTFKPKPSSGLAGACVKPGSERATVQRSRIHQVGAAGS